MTLKKPVISKASIERMKKYVEPRHSPLAYAAQIADGDDGQEDQRQLDAIHVKARQRRGDGGHAGRDAHRHREDVVGKQGCRGDESGIDADVLARHDVGAAAAGIGMNCLPI